jgi:DNA adenine methylase
MSIPHPIPYQGSKRALAPAILNYFPEDADRLIEPFAGSAAVSLAAASRGIVDHVLLNDINGPLIALWHSIVYTPEKLAEAYETLWRAQAGRERKFYDLVRTRFNKTQQPYYLLYLLARCVKAAVRYNASGDFNQSPDNRRKGRHPGAMGKDIRETSLLLKDKVSLMAGDYHSALDLATPHDIMYLDPPYQGVCATRDPRYMNKVLFDDFVEALHALNKRAISFIVSYDGRTDKKSFGNPLPEFLNLKHIELNAGRSSQATLLGRKAITYESLYLSPALVERLERVSNTITPCPPPTQLALFEASP